MRGLYSSAALVVLVACVGPGSTPSGDPSTTVSGDDDGDHMPPPPPPPPPTCPIGADSFTRAMGLSGSDTPLDVAVTANGGVAFAALNGEAAGVTLLSASGDILTSFPFGSVVATDRLGNTLVAGGFTQPIDFGNGVLLNPSGNIDTFIAKIDANGKVVFARALGLCGDGVTSLAVANDLRIAVSGTALGTVVLSAGGDVEFTLAVSGDVAFDSEGFLAIAGNTGVDGFVMLVDRAGTTIYSHALTGADSVKSIAVDRDDNIVFVGWTTGTADILGVTIVARSATEAGRVTGAFVAKLDAMGNLVFVIPLATEATGVAVDAFGNIAVNGASTGNTGFDRLTSLMLFTPTGVVRQHFFEFVASGDGRGKGVAADACGSIYATFDALDTPSPASPLRAYVVKVSP
jgi:hypothetical protein